jgi:hypothetical protein
MKEKTKVVKPELTKPEDVPASGAEDAPANELTARVPLEPPKIVKGKVNMLPAIIALGFYMLMVAAGISYGVVTGNVPRIFLIVSALFVAASFGLLRLFRWAWALTLAGTLSLMMWYFWIFYSTKQGMSIVMGILNLVFFFYLVRPDVRSRLR